MWSGLLVRAIRTATSAAKIALDWPAWVQHLSPFAWVPTVPVEAWTAGSAVGLLAVVAALLLVGFTAFRRRDLVTG